jgi:heat shock protein HtpX
VAVTSTPTGAELGRAVAENKRRALLSLSAFASVFLVAGCVIGLVLGVLVLGAVFGLVFGVALAVSAYLRSDRIALARSRAVAADVQDHPRYHNLVEGLCVAAGLPKPELYVIDDPGRNVLAVGRDPKHASLAATTGLLDDLNRVELEGVLASELSRIKSHDTSAPTAAVVPSVLLGPLSMLVTFGGSHAEQVLVADASGVQMTRYPPGLCSALHKVDDGRSVVRSASRATEAMWLASPFAPGAAGGDHAPYPPLRERIRVLEEM